MSASDAAPAGGSSVSDLIARIARAKNHYETLGVEDEDHAAVDVKVLTRAYRRLALRLHPDKCRAAGAEDAFKKVGHAYATLSSPEGRAHYDRFGSDAPAGGGGFGGAAPQRQDAAEFFREFMARNPDVAAAWSAGSDGVTRGPEGGVDLSGFDFSAATLAGGKAWWERRAEELPDSALLRVPFRLLGRVIFALVYGFTQTMPYSGGAAFALLAYLGARVMWWTVNRGIWLFAFGQVPASIRPRFWFAIQILILLLGEYYGFVFDFPRGAALYFALSLVSRRAGSGGGGNAQQPRSSFSSFSFTTFPQGGSPSFVHVGSSSAGGRNGGNIGGVPRTSGARAQQRASVGR